MSLATKDRLDVVAIWIAYKCGIVIGLALTRRSVVSSACFDGCCVKCVDVSPTSGHKGGMLFDRVRRVSIDPVHRIFEAIANAVSPHVFRDLLHSTHAKCPQSGVVEIGGTTHIRNANTSVVNHGGPPTNSVEQYWPHDITIDIMRRAKPCALGGPNLRPLAPIFSRGHFPW